MSEFIHRPYREGETIAAIATPPGEGGVAIVRISGKEAIAVAGKVFSKPVEEIESHTLKFGQVIDAKGAVVDEVLLVVMRSPRSFTGENVVEIHCHGGSLITKRVLEMVLEAGARAALPGEFSFKAFMSGKLDLAQAEAIQALIGAKNDVALGLAQQQLEGALSREIEGIQKSLSAVAAILEAWVDFPEEGLEFASEEEVLGTLHAVRGQVHQLVESFEEGKLVHTGISLCLVGPPNVGKSSLMNALLRKERAIVTPVAGTTRDLLEEEMRLGGLHFRLMDTAGIRVSNEVVEQEGIRRSRTAMERADIVLLVLDATSPLDGEGKELLAAAPKGKTIVVWNKIDLEHGDLPEQGLPMVALSAKTKAGLEELKEAITSKVFVKGVPSKEDVVITHVRHARALNQAGTALGSVIEGLEEGVSPEFLTADMREALMQLGTIIGTNITEDILSSIFSTFCVGK